MPSKNQYANMRAVPLPEYLLANPKAMDNTLKIIGITFGAGLLVGGCVLLIFVSLWRIYLKNEKSKQIASASLGNPRVACNMGETLATMRKCTYIILRSDGGHGSGISIGDGYIMTNKHVVAGASGFRTRVNGTLKELELVNSSPDQDVALVRGPTNIPRCNFFDPKQLAPGEELFAVGWPKEKDQLDPAVTRGVFSRLNTQTDGNEYIQTDAAINPGNSGGSLVNECGVVGMNTAKFSWFDTKTPIEGLSLAMKSVQALEIVAKIKK